ncbi:MAG TPA: hypothetical protein VFQ42_19125, partial [Mycobacterium sp.]|nr:hypothetical protein [Mycobacterium sp.]
MIRITTKDLVGLLTDLVHTAAHPDTGSTTASVLLHTARGYAHGDEPGVSDLLVGTSTDGSMVGHAFEACYGQASEPMLWSIGDVK